MPTESPEELSARLRAEHEARKETAQVTNLADRLPRMGMEGKWVTGKAAEIMAHLHEGEPVFILRAQDILSVMVIRHYAKLVEDYCHDQSGQLETIVQAANDFAQWQRENAGKVKLPD